MILFRACKRQNVLKKSPFEWRQAQSDTAVGNKIQVKIRIIWNAHWQSITDEQTESYHKRFCMRGSQCASRQTLANLVQANAKKACFQFAECSRDS